MNGRQANTTPHPGVVAAEADVAWMAQAACRGKGTDLFFPTRTTKGAEEDPQAAVKAICARCPVRAECLAYALAIGTQHGIWGGKATRERNRMRRTARRAS